MPNVKALWIQRLGRPGVASILAWLFLGIVSVGPGGAQTQGPVLNAARVPSPGEIRTVKVNEQTITAVYAGREGSFDCWNVKSSNGNVGKFCNTVEGNLVSRQGSVGTPVVINPHNGALSFPMFVGKQWEQAYSYQNGSEGMRNEKRTASVVSYEKLAVTAGTFDVFKIQVTRSWWGGDLSDSQGARAGTMRGSSSQGTYYYSGKVGMVKVDDGFDHTELLASSAK